MDVASILVVDDDKEVARTIRSCLQRENHDIRMVHGGVEALHSVQKQRPDLIVLDILMPDMNGIEVCRRLRADERTANVPIIFLTAMGRLSDKIEGFEAGGDDYLTKPFELEELTLRVRAILRRSQSREEKEKESPTELVVGGLTLDCRTFRATTPERTVLLTPTEFKLLRYMMSHTGEIISSERLLQDVWNYPPGTGDAALVRMHIKNLRTKLETAPHDPVYIRTVGRHGYTINQTPPHTSPTSPP